MDNQLSFVKNNSGWKEFSNYLFSTRLRLDYTDYTYSTVIRSSLIMIPAPLILILTCSLETSKSHCQSHSQSHCKQFLNWSTFSLKSPHHQFWILFWHVSLNCGRKIKPFNPNFPVTEIWMVNVQGTHQECAVQFQTKNNEKTSLQGLENPVPTKNREIVPIWW